MSSFFYSILAQAETSSGSDWNWLLIFIIFVVVLAVALVIQTRFSTQEAEELTLEIHHEEEAHHKEAEPGLAPETVVEEPEPESETTALEDLVESDDLKRIEGIGPKVVDLLSENGITTFSKLAETSVEALADILEAAQLQMMDPASWPQQAELAAASNWEALEKLQDELKGGR